MAGTQAAVLDERVDSDDRARGEQPVGKDRRKNVRLDLPRQFGRYVDRGLQAQRHRGQRGQAQQAGCHAAQDRFGRAQQTDQCQLQPDQRQGALDGQDESARADDFGIQELAVNQQAGAAERECRN